MAANDGVGTKLRVALAARRHDTVGIDLVAMSVNDLVVQGAEPLFFLDYFACGKLDVGTAEAVIGGIAEGCRQAGCALIGGETAEMPGMYHGDDYDLAGFAVGAVERKKLLPRKSLKPGNIIIGLKSSGPHSNGFSLIRKLVEQTGLSYLDDAPFAPGQTLGEALLTPTRIYVRSILSVFNSVRGVKGFAHITGGGFVENVPRVLPEDCAAHIDLDAVEPHAVFGWLAVNGGMDEREMLTTFNCGIGMIAVVAPNAADDAMLSFADQGEEAVVLGEVRPRQGDDPQVVFSGELGL